jgi:hypothetical protein
MNTATLALAQDVATAVSGLFNAGYFGRYWLRRPERRSRRVGAAALVVVGVATAFEAAFSQGAVRYHDQLLAFGGASDGLWALARLPLLLASGFITIIVIRRLMS